MDWLIGLLGILAPVLLLIFAGFPVALAFMCVNLAGLYLMLGPAALSLLGGSAFSAIGSFVLVPIPLFILMGEILFRSGVAVAAIEAVDRWIGRIPGRLSLTAVGGGTVFGAVSGASMASVALLGSVLAPEMRKKGYHPAMIAGPILGSSGLAILIPPSALGVLLGSLAMISISKFLLAIILPGLILALMYGLYFFLRSVISPSVAPAYEFPRELMRSRIIGTAKLIPLILLMVIVTGFIFLGIATPTEAAALGVIGALVIVACYSKLTVALIKEAAMNTAMTSSMILLIIVGSSAFSQLLASSHAIQGLLDAVLRVEMTPLLFVLIAMALVLFLGCIIDGVSIMMITVPVFYPIVSVLGIDPIWFSVLLLVQIELATITPPFGFLLFVLQGVQPELNIRDIYRAVLPIMFMQMTLILLLILAPGLTSILPDMMFQK